VSQDEGQQQVTTFSTVLLLAVDEPPRSAEPSGCPGFLATVGEVKTKPERAAGGGKDLSGPQMSVIGIVHRLREVVLLADKASSLRSSAPNGTAWPATVNAWKAAIHRCRRKASRPRSRSR
jgi:ABC-type uncharacterized transport system ATPase subunit